MVVGNEEPVMGAVPDGTSLCAYECLKETHTLNEFHTKKFKQRGRHVGGGWMVRCTHGSTCGHPAAGRGEAPGRVQRTMQREPRSMHAAILMHDCTDRNHGAHGGLWRPWPPCALVLQVSHARLNRRRCRHRRSEQHTQARPFLQHPAQEHMSAALKKARETANAALRQRSRTCFWSCVTEDAER